jgi:GT2 family glycosyltransferase/glycosyltransferase involved in cell wall biosynthesis
MVLTKRRSGVVSVILVNFRGADDTITCVRGLLGLNWPRERLEIIVVENGSGDDSFVRLKELGDEIVLVRSKDNLGFTGGCNLGFEHATGEFIAFLNNDARPHPDWIAEGIASFGGGLDVGAVASKVLDWEGERVDYLDSAITWYGMGYKPHAGEQDNGAWDEEKDVLFGTGAAMFMRSHVFEKLGGFDDNYFMFYDDVDLGWRMNLLGYRFRFQPKSVAYHKHHASMAEFGNFREEYLLERNALYTLYKNLDDQSLQKVLPAALLLAVRRGVARGKLDSTALDLRNPGNDAEPDLAVSKSTAAGLFAIDQFVEHLPQMRKAREEVQSSRVVTDGQLGRKFGNVDEPAYPIPYYQRGYENIMSTLPVLPLGTRKRVAVITGDPIGARMAGPAIRAWNMAKQLAKENDVRLLTMSRAELDGDGFTVHAVSYSHPHSMHEHEAWADVIVLQGHALQLFPVLASSSKVLVVDVYDPLQLEQLEQGRKHGTTGWNRQIGEARDTLNHQLALGDYFLCASERQRHFWLGQLAGLGRVNAYTYSRDSELNSLIGVVPFGTPDEPALRTGAGPRETIPGIGKDDKLVVWAGGIYEWFDPETLIEAVAMLAEQRPDVRLLFMGVKHPNPTVPEMDVVSRSRALAERLGVLGTNVFFNESWVPYHERQNYLLDADLGVSTHFNHIETTFSFRTRILDYLWAGLPIVTTEGDSFAELVASRGLGASIPEHDAKALARALETYLYDEKAVAIARRNVEAVRDEFRWERVLQPLVEFCRNPMRAADKEPSEVPAHREAEAVAAVRTPAPYGWRRDVSRAVYYLRSEGPSGVYQRVRTRLALRRGA